MEKHFKIRKDLSMEYKGYTLYRIEATKDLPDHNVKKGDLGGWIENEDRLSENAWIADEAKVFADARVGGNAEICGEAEVRDYAKILGNTLIFGNAKVHGNAKIRGCAKIGGNAMIFGNAVVKGYAEVNDDAKVSGDALIHDYARIIGNAVVYGDANIWYNAKVCGNAEVIGDVLEQENDCKNIIGVRYNITITPKYIKIGCQYHTKEEWWSFTDREILEMDGKEGLKWWKKWKPALQLICKEEE